MNLAESWIRSSWMEALGWTFVHSIWQIAVIGLLLFVVLRCIPGRSAHMRYTISTMALWLIVVMALSTFILMLPTAQSVETFSGRVVMVHGTESLTLTQKWSQWLETRMPMMLTIWLGGVAILMMRLLFSLGWVSHIRYESFPEEQLQESLNHIISRLALKVKAVTSESHYIKSPVTIGHLKPLILFPVGIVNQLTPKEVEAILTHELAHIVRRDYLSNLIQSFIETIFYYHPVVWWISRTVRSERENRADDLAVSWCGDHLAYAKALMTVQEMQVHPAPSITVGFASRKGMMLARIQRILNLPYKNHNQMEKTVLLSLCSLCFLAFTLSSHTPDNQPGADKPALVSASSNVLQAVVSADTIPAKGTYKIHKKTDDQDISIEVEDGDVKSLQIDGKSIEPSAFDQYDEVISDLFGVIEAPIAVEGFQFNMPPMPSIPSMPSMPPMPSMPLMPPSYSYNFNIPPLPPMPSMPNLDNLSELEMEKMLEGNNHIRWFGEDGQIGIWSGDDLARFEIMADSMLLIYGKDSSLFCTPRIAWLGGDSPAAIAFNEEAFEKWGKEMQQNAEIWGKEWQAQDGQWKAWAEQWREQQQQWKEQLRKEQQEMRQQWRQNADQWREEQDRAREEIRSQQRSPRADEGWDHERQRQEELRLLMPAPRMSMSDEMVRDGLIQPGQETEVQLTPDKLKINGKKMEADVHEKYLRMYERQQGVELSGNSRVEFTTRSKQRM